MAQLTHVGRASFIMDAKISADKKARVLTSAEMVFLQQGYARTTMGDLAGAAGMSRPALYLVYPRKHELFSSIIQEEAKGPETPRPPRGETDRLQHWMMWVCDLWLGEYVAEPGDGVLSIGKPHQRSESFPREVSFLQSILQDGLEKRLPWAVDEPVCASVARLLTFCVCGLVDAHVDPAERKALLEVQIDALAEAALRPQEREAPHRIRSRIVAGRSATVRALPDC